MIGVGMAVWGDAHVRLDAHKSYFEELVYMKAAPDAARGFCGALNRPPLERFDLGPRRI